MIEKIIACAKRYDADIVGFAPADRFSADDPIFKIFPGTKTVIGLGFRVLRGIYRGEHIPFVGSFVAFMQSVAGYLCILLVILGMIAIPLVEKRVNAVKRERLIAIGVIEPEGGDKPL